jgi:hypothetical protein
MSTIYNTVNKAYVNAYIAADEAESLAQLRKEYKFHKDTIEALAEDVLEAEKEVADERSWWNVLASGAGCAVGGAIGFVTGGAPGAVQGCSAGSGIATTGADYLYDLDDPRWNTDMENDLKEYAAVLDDYDVDFSQLAMRFNKHGGYEKEMSLDDYADAYYKDYLAFDEGFYAKQGEHYLGDLFNIGVSFAASKFGESVLDSWWKGPNIDTTSGGVYKVGSYDYGYGSILPDTIPN